MATESLSLSTVLSAQPEAVYGAWLGAEQHGSTGDGARIGAGFTAWNGMSHGVTLELTPPSKIVQSWRTEDFGSEEPDSRVEVTIESDGAGGSRLTLSHTGIPEGHSDSYRDGWKKHLEPMERELGSGSTGAAMPAPKAVKTRTAAARKTVKKKAAAARKRAKPAPRTAGKRAAGKRATRRPAKKARKAPARRTAGKRAAGKRATKKKVPARRGAKRGARKTRR